MTFIYYRSPCSWSYADQVQPENMLHENGIFVRTRHVKIDVTAAAPCVNAVTFTVTSAMVRDVTRDGMFVT